MSTSLLRTKLYKPRPPRALVPRPDLTRQLEEAQEQDLTLVVAPVGFGKTTLVAAWAAQSAQPVAWLTLDEHDNDPALFLAYLVAALQTIFPGACPETAAILRGAGMPDSGVLTSLLVNEIDDLPQRFTLVLDDYHNLRARAVHQLLDAMLRHPPLQMRLLIASRADPPLALTRLRANGRLAELRIHQLRFTPQEAALFLEQAIGPERFVGAAELLYRRAEGWVAGMQLAVISLRTVPDQAAMLDELARRIDRSTMDYLFEQVLAHQPPAVQTFLLKTSLLERLSTSLAQALLQGDALASTIAPADLERDGLFVTALDNAGEWFAYHALFRELLRHQLTLRHSPEQIAALHRQASIWFAQQELVDEALHHALAAGEIDRAAQLIVDHFVGWLGREDWRAIERWLAVLPAVAFATHPWLLVIKANVLQIQSDWDAMSRLLREIDERLGEGTAAVESYEQAVLWGSLELLRAIHCSIVGEGQKVIDRAHQALAVLPPNHLYVRGGAQTVLIVAMQVTGNMTEAEQLMQAELLLPPPGADRARHRLRILLNLLSLHLGEGNLETAEQYAAAMLQEAIDANAPVSQLWAHLALGARAYCADDLVRAAEHFAHGADLRRSGHVRGGHECLVGLALTYQAMGRTEEARGVATLLADDHRQQVNPQLRAEGVALQWHLALLNGDATGALPPLIDVSPLPALWYGWMEIPAITRIRALLAAPSPANLEEAEAAVEALLALLADIHKPPRKAELLALSACVLEMRGAREAACQALAAAVALAEPRGLVRALADAGPQIGTLVDALAVTQPSPFLARVRAALHPPEQVEGSGRRPVPPAPAVPTPRLTRREREVLGCLIAYLTDREIAEKLVISPLTVRTHIEHIGEKLGVSGRRAIIVRALESGVLA